MKKIYKTPVIVVVKIESEILLAGSTYKIDIADGPSSSTIGDGGEIESKPNSKWGDCWN